MKTVRKHFTDQDKNTIHKSNDCVGEFLHFGYLPTDSDCLKTGGMWNLLKRVGYCRERLYIVGNVCQSKIIFFRNNKLHIRRNTVNEKATEIAVLLICFYYLEWFMFMKLCFWFPY